MSFYEFVVAVEHYNQPIWYESGIVHASDFEGALNKLKAKYHSDNTKVLELTYVTSESVYIADGWEGFK